MTDLTFLRLREFPVAADEAYLDHAAASLLPQRTRAAVLEHLTDHTRRGSAGFPDWIGLVEDTRAHAARLLGADTDEVALCTNTSQGLSWIAQSFPWAPGDRVVAFTPDFPTNVYPWMHLERERGVALTLIERDRGRIDLDRVRAALGPDVRMLAVSSVDYATGFRADLRALSALCAEHDVVVVVDAIQSLGALAHDLHAEGIHALVAGGHKWLQAPLGAGLLYVSRALRERLTPPEVGWKSVTNDTDFSIHFDLKPEARMFEAGTPNVAGVAGLRASLQLLLEVGPATIEARIQATTAALADLARAHGWEVVSPWGPDERSGILSLVPTVPLEPLHDHLQASGVRCSVRGGRLRLSPHWYNNAADVQRFAQALDACPVS